MVEELIGIAAAEAGGVILERQVDKVPRRKFIISLIIIIILVISIFTIVKLIN
jgi:hypothetical protein